VLGMALAAATFVGHGEQLLPGDVLVLARNLRTRGGALLRVDPQSGVRSAVTAFGPSKVGIVLCKAATAVQDRGVTIRTLGGAKHMFVQPEALELILSCKDCHQPVSPCSVPVNCLMPNSFLEATTRGRNTLESGSW
jgi:hypothetical protein